MFEMTLMISELVNQHGLIAATTSATQLAALVENEVVLHRLLGQLLAAADRTRLLDVLAVLQHVLYVVVVLVSNSLL